MNLMMYFVAGIKFIPLRTPGGELIPGSGLFVQIKKTATANASEASDREAAKAKEGLSNLHVRQISRQEAIERETINDESNVTVKDGESDKAENSDMEGKFDSEDQEASYYKRRFTSPAVLEGSGDLFEEYDSSKLTVMAEVHENTAL